MEDTTEWIVTSRRFINDRVETEKFHFLNEEKAVDKFLDIMRTAKNEYSGPSFTYTETPVSLLITKIRKGWIYSDYAEIFEVCMETKTI